MFRTEQRKLTLDAKHSQLAYLENNYSSLQSSCQPKSMPTGRCLPSCERRERLFARSRHLCHQALERRVHRQLPMSRNVPSCRKSRRRSLSPETHLLLQKSQQLPSPARTSHPHRRKPHNRNRARRMLRPPRNPQTKRQLCSASTRLMRQRSLSSRVSTLAAFKQTHRALCIKPALFLIRQRNPRMPLGPPQLRRLPQ